MAVEAKFADVASGFVGTYVADVAEAAAAEHGVGGELLILGGGAYHVEGDGIAEVGLIGALEDAENHAAGPSGTGGVGYAVDDVLLAQVEAYPSGAAVVGGIDGGVVIVEGFGREVGGGGGLAGGIVHGHGSDGGA